MEGLLFRTKMLSQDNNIERRNLPPCTRKKGAFQHLAGVEFGPFLRSLRLCQTSAVKTVPSEEILTLKSYMTALSQPKDAFSHDSIFGQYNVSTALLV